MSGLLTSQPTTIQMTAGGVALEAVCSVLPHGGQGGCQHGQTSGRGDRV